MQLAIPVQFTGNAKEYFYTFGHLLAAPRIGDRVVIPNKLKENDLSLSIATVSGPMKNVADEELLLPVVALIPRTDIDAAAQAVRWVESKKGVQA